MSSKKSPKASVSPSKKKLKTYEQGVKDAINAVVKFCAAQEKTLKTEVKRFAKNEQYVEAHEATMEMDTYSFLANGLTEGWFDLDLELEDSEES